MTMEMVWLDEGLQSSDDASDTLHDVCTTCYPDFSGASPIIAVCGRDVMNDKEWDGDEDAEPTCVVCYDLDGCLQCGGFGR